MSASLDRPVPLPVRVDGIPDALRTERRWLIWRYWFDESKGKWTKPPHLAVPPYHKCNPTDRSLHRTFDEALQAYQLRKSDGIGLALGDGLVGFDADGTMARDIVAQLNSYAEVSPSGKGVHVLMRGVKPASSCKREPYELYDTGRYFTVTGHHIEGTPKTIEERTAEIAALYHQFFAVTKSVPVSASAPSGSKLTDDEVLDKAKKARNGKKFLALWNGEHKDHSRADAALCALLAFWTNKDAEQMDRLFRRSLLKRDKWDERRGKGTYGELTIVNAIAECKDTYGAANGIVMRPGEMSAIVDQGVEKLVAAGVPIYQRGGVLVRAVRLDAHTDAHHLRRQPGSTVLTAVRENWLLEQLSLATRWLRPTANGDFVPADPEAKYARMLLDRGEWPAFPVLRGVLNAPTLALDGRIIETPGYDTASGLLLDFAPGSFPPVPANPTQDQARSALECLAKPLREFPFVDGAAKSVALAGLLTVLIRRSIRTAPLHGFDAPTAGTGKSLLAEMVGLLGTAVRPPALSQGKSDEEDEKRLSTVLFAGDPVILIDNCERAVSGDFLCSMLTQEVVQARILGLSERRVLPSTALVLATGNNLTFAGDTTRRAVVCRLDARMERPDSREFKFDCHKEVLDSRPELVVAGLTILRAYHVGGRPRPAGFKPMGGFNDYDWIRGALVWLERADPANTRSAILDNDPRKNELIEVMEVWTQAFGEVAATVGDIGEADARDKDKDSIAALKVKFAEAVCRGGEWNPKSVGWWLRRQKDRVVNKRCFRCEAVGAQQVWRLEGEETASGTQQSFPCDEEARKDVPF